MAELMRLAGRTELAEMLGVSRQRARQLTERDDFPGPIAQLRRGPIWRVEDIEAWAEQVGRTLRPLPEAEEE
jgi:predicted DNA-binding transcriptional regulator AlpA